MAMTTTEQLPTWEVTDSAEQALVTGAVAVEQGFVQTYERQRQLGMLAILAPAFLVISALLILLFTVSALLFPNVRVFGATLPQPLLLDGPLLLAVACHAAAIIFVRRERVLLPSVLVLTGSAGAIVAILAVWVWTNGLDILVIVGLTTLSTVIVIAGALGSRALIVAVTALINVITVIIIGGAILGGALAPAVADGVQTQLALFAPTILMVQWAIAVTMIAQWRAMRRTLQEVGIAYERARQLDALKNQFISSVNHELRTPLATLQTYIQTCLLGWDRIAPQKIRDALQHADRVSRALSDLVKDILSTRTIEQEAQGIVLGPVNLRDVIDRALTLVDPSDGSTAMRDLHLRVAPDLVVWAEAVRLQQIMTNLVSNALKYSSEGSPLTIEARTLAPTSQGRRAARIRSGEGATKTPAVEILVSDNGLGIPPEQIPLLFQRFVRLPRDLASTITGTGLGLYLCRTYMEAMGGRIWVESSGVPGEGSRFYLQLQTPPTRRSVMSQAR
jgi:signal transduction histidine kinase